MARAEGSARRPAKYLYGVIRTETPVRFGTTTIAGCRSEVVTVNHGNLAAVVSDVAVPAVAPTRENLLAHEEVDELVIRRFTPIPASFGTVVASTDSVIDLLRANRSVFHGLLDRLDSKVQYSVKALWDRDAAVRAIEAADPRLHLLAVASRAGSVSSRESARRRYARVLASRVQRRITRHTDGLLAAVRDLVVASRLNRPLGDAVLLNMAFLVARDREKEFVSRVCEVGGACDDVTLRYGGPWPAYDFVSIPVTAEPHR